MRAVRAAPVSSRQYGKSEEEKTSTCASSCSVVDSSSATPAAVFEVDSIPGQKLTRPHVGRSLLARWQCVAYAEVPDPPVPHEDVCLAVMKMTVSAPLTPAPPAGSVTAAEGLLG